MQSFVQVWELSVSIGVQLCSCMRDISECLCPINDIVEKFCSCMDVITECRGPKNDKIEKFISCMRVISESRVPASFM